MASPSSFSMPMILSSGWSRPSLSAAMSGHDLGHDRVAVFRPERGADPLQGEVELLVEHVLQVLGAQVRGVGVEGLGQARQIDFQQLAGIDLVGLAVAVAIADRPLAHRFGFVDVVDHFGEEQVELDLLAQPLVGFGLVDGEVELFGVVGQVLVDREVALLLEQLHRGLVPLVLALQESLENLLGEVDISIANLVVEGRSLPS